MKKSIVIAIMILLLTLTACSKDEMEVQALQVEKSQLQNEINTLKQDLDYYKTNLADFKNQNNIEIYAVKLSIKQSHFTLDFGQHIKDSMNEVIIDIPVSKQFYDKVNKGDVLDNSFRMGSFLMNGSIGSWNITITDKYIVR